MEWQRIRMELSDSVDSEKQDGNETSYDGVVCVSVCVSVCVV